MEKKANSMEDKPWMMVGPSKAEYDRESFDSLRNQFDEMLQENEKFRTRFQEMKKVFEELNQSGIVFHDNVFNAEGGRIKINTQHNHGADSSPRIIVLREYS